MKHIMMLADTQNGFTLIEVLVALIVVAIGLLGLANLQTVGLRNTNSNLLTSQAIFLANDIIDRARSNVELTSNNYYGNNYSDNSAYDCSEEVSPISVDCTDPETACTPQQIMQYDRWEWQKFICQKQAGTNSRLPNAKLIVCIDSDPFDNKDCDTGNAAIKGVTPYMVKLEWDDPTQQNSRQQLVVPFQVVRMPDKAKEYLSAYK